ncbi:MAG TPA: Ig-like domain-containing protein, partial [Thermoplasmata archaeon]|nr:Ig-like domain-containing protein [Thermoplasmata archaeon]
SSDIAGKPPKTGAPMLVFKLTDDIEVVPNAFMCDSSTCTSPTPSNPAFIVPGNRGIRMEWNAPVKELRIKQYWQIEFGVRSYTNGSNVKVNDVANSFVQYDRYDGSPGGSDVFEQLYVTVEPVVCNPGCLTRVEVSPPTASLLVGGQQQFAAQAFDQNGQPMSGVSFAWGVNGSIGQVTQSGMFTAQTVGSGDVWVDGTFNGTSRKSNARVTVSSPAPDTYPPRVVSTDPADQATAVPLSSKMSITWNESMDTASAVSAFSSTPAVACAWSWSGGTVQVCATATQFDPSTKYEVVISTAAKDVAGNALAAEMRFSFTTVAAPDTTPPVIVHTPPGAVVEGTDVGIKARVTDAGGVDAVDLHYRPAGASAFKRIPMPKISGSDFGGTILAIDVKPGKIQYYLEASDKSGNTANWPAGGASAPQMITVNPKDGGTQPPPPEPGGILGMGSTMDAVILGSIIAALIVALLAVMMMRKKKSAQAAPPPMGGQGKWGPPPTGADPWGQQGQGQQQWQPPPQGGQGGWR